MQQQYDTLRKAHERLASGATSLAEWLGKDLPQLPVDTQVTR